MPSQAVCKALTNQILVGHSSGSGQTLLSLPPRQTQSKASTAGKAPACPRTLTCYHELHGGADLALGPVGGDARVVPRVAPAHFMEGQDASIVADVGWQAAPICRTREDRCSSHAGSTEPHYTAASPVLEVGHEGPKAQVRSRNITTKCP